MDAPTPRFRLVADDAPATRPRLDPAFLVPLAGFGAAALACAAAGVAFTFAGESARSYWLTEGGPIEAGSAWLYLAVAVVAGGLAAWRARRPGRTFVAPLLLAACVLTLAARENDWHNRWTTQCVLKTRFYVSPDVPLFEKVAAACVLAAVGVLVVLTARTLAGPTLAALRAGRAEARLACVGVALLPVSKMLDSLPGLVRRNFGVEQVAFRDALGGTEELLEFAAPLLFLAAALAALRPGRPAAGPAETELRRAA